MKKLILSLLIFCSAFSIKAQNTSGGFRLGFTASLDKNLSSERMAFDKYAGYNADYNKTNYRVGLNLEYEFKPRFAINTTINYSNKDFTGTYFCETCHYEYMAPAAQPVKIDFRTIEVPLSLRYYFLPDKLRILGEIGVNNQFFLNKDVTDKRFGLGLKLGAGAEYNFFQGIALQVLVDYNKGITNLYDESDFKMDNLGVGIGILRRF